MRTRPNSPERWISQILLTIIFTEFIWFGLHLLGILPLTGKVYLGLLLVVGGWRGLR